MNNILIKCPDGFVNQLRLSLAADFLMSIGEVKTAKQEWILNNHNIVDYKKFFTKLKYLEFDKVDDHNPIKTCSFCSLVSRYGCPRKILKRSFENLRLIDGVEKYINNFFIKNKLENSIGLHLRTGCKTAILKSQKNRHQPIPQEKIIQFLKTINSKIYLATDNEETQNKFIEIFNNRLVYFQKIKGGKEIFDGHYDPRKVERNGTDLHVIADFFILQRCKNFIGSNESSFSIMINWVRNNPSDYILKGIL